MTGRLLRELADLIDGGLDMPRLIQPGAVPTIEVTPEAAPGWCAMLHAPEGHRGIQGTDGTLYTTHGHLPSGQHVDLFWFDAKATVA